MRKPTLWLMAKGLLSLGILVYLVYHIHLTPPKIPMMTWLHLLPFALLITLGAIMAMAYRWYLLLQPSCPNSKYQHCLKGYFIGTLFNIIAPGSIGGDIIRTGYSQLLYKLGFKKALSIVLQERLTGIVAIGLLLTIGCINHSPWRHLHLTYHPMTLKLSLLILLGLTLFLLRWTHKRYSQLSTGLFSQALALSLTAQLADVLTTYICLHTLNQSLPFSALLVVMPIVYLASVLPISLGGLGVRESTFATLLWWLHQTPLSLSICIAFMLFAAKLLAGICFGLPSLWTTNISWQDIKAFYAKSPAQ